jgi:hypothetical protein
MEGILRKAWIACAATAALLVAGAASAAPTITNGNFTTNGGNGQLNFNTTLTGWNTVPSAFNQGYVFIFNPGAGASGSTADTTGAVGSLGTVRLYGPGNVPPTNNGFTVDNLSGGGGAFVASDPAFNNIPLETTVTGLTPGDTYQISFDWAAGQQFGFTGQTTAGWDVSIGATNVSTGAATVNTGQFVPWSNDTFKFTATGTSDVLSFLAIGGASAAQPPFALLDNVSVTPVPEPASWALMLLGVGALGAGLRMRRREVFAAA